MLRQFCIGMSVGLVLPQTTVADLAPLHAIANGLAGFEVMPEWQVSARPAANDLASNVAASLRGIASGEPASPLELFMAHLRLLEWIGVSGFEKSLVHTLGTRMARDWNLVLERSAALLTNPLQLVPPIREASAAPIEGQAFAARLLLAAAPAVRAPLSESYRAALEAKARAT